jgi:hypothetical protein
MKLFPSTILFRLFFFFGMMEMAVCFLFFLLHYRRSFESEQMGGWTSVFSTSQRFRRTFTFDDTLVFNDCMEWVNIPRWDGYRLGWHGQKIQFPFLVKCAIGGYQKGLVDCKDHQRLFELETDTQLTFHSYIQRLFAIREVCSA